MLLLCARNTRQGQIALSHSTLITDLLKSPLASHRKARRHVGRYFTDQAVSMTKISKALTISKIAGPPFYVNALTVLPTEHD